MLVLLLATALLGATHSVPVDYPSIQAAIDAAQTGDTVEVLAGTYEEALTLKPGITIEGTGADAVVVRRKASDGPVLTVKSCDSGAVRGMTFEHTDTPAKDNAEAQPAAAVDIRDSSVEISACTVRGSAGSGIRIEGKSAIRVIECSVTDNLRLGIYGLGADVALTAVGNTSTGNSCGIVFRDGADGTARNNTCSKNVNYGIEVAGKAASPVLSGNTCSENGLNGIHYNDWAGGAAVGNRCLDNGANGIAVTTETRPELRNNVCQGNKWFGILFDGNNRSVNSGNVYTDNGHTSEQEVYRLFNQDRFEDIEAIAQRMRRDKTKGLEGEWQIPFVYAGMLIGCNRMDANAEREYLQRIERWGEAFPESITRLVTLGHAQVEFGWRERGGGWASEVTEEEAKGFQKYLELAMGTVAKAEKLQQKDPQLYVVKMKALLGLGPEAIDLDPVMGVLSYLTGANLTPADPGEQAFLQGVALEPTYYPLYSHRTVHLMPFWYGSPAKVAAFADRAADMTKQYEGEGLYARVATTALVQAGQDDFRKYYHFSWPRIRQGYRDILKMYPESSFRKQMFTRMACIYGDRRTAAPLFAEFGEAWDDDVWVNEEHFKRWKRWAAGEAESPRNNELEAAVRTGDADRVKSLIDAGADPDSLAEDAETMLRTAIEMHESDVAKVLIEAGADVNRTGPDRLPPVVDATRIKDDSSILFLLLKHGADPNVVSAEGWTPLLEAIGRGDEAKALLLLDHGADPKTGRKDYTPLHYAASKHLPTVIRKLIEKGGDPNARHEDGATPVHAAAESQDLDSATALVEMGADPDIPHIEGWTPLYEAVKRNQLEMVRLFVAHGGDVTVRQDHDGSLFHEAAKNGSLPLLQYLVEVHPDGLNFVNEEKRTLLHEAASAGQTETARFLLEKGLDPNARDAEGSTAFDLAQRGRHRETAALLEAK